MTKINKSKLMTRAWELYKTGHYDKFSNTLKQAWMEAKEEQALRADGYVHYSELQVGDTIGINYGRADNGRTIVIASIETKVMNYGSASKITTIISNESRSVEFVAKGMIKRISTIAVEAKAA